MSRLILVLCNFVYFTLQKLNNIMRRDCSNVKCPGSLVHDRCISRPGLEDKNKIKCLLIEILCFHAHNIHVEPQLSPWRLKVFYTVILNGSYDHVCLKGLHIYIYIKTRKLHFLRFLVHNRASLTIR